ncbi:hypothetical protein AB3X91_17435 [Paraburkholderia sp. BR14263]|uniref:hypothetical protein n=1 Tax=unclassified Paraburkholderia TaxID=2615204 RepID=UPI0034CE3297
MRAHYATLLEGKPIPFHLERDLQVLDRSDHAFILDVSAEENLERRDAAIGELLNFQDTFHHFQERNYRRDPHMPVDDANRLTALRDLVVDCRRLCKALAQTLFLGHDFSSLDDWRPENAGNVSEFDLTLWLGRVDRALTKMVSLARYLVLDRERAYWSAKLPEIVDKVKRLSLRTPESWTREAWVNGASRR